MRERGTMRTKLLALTLALIAVLAMASPAQAIHYGKNTFLHSWNDTTVAVTVMVNKHDTNCCLYEGLSDSYEFTNPDAGADPDIRYDWVQFRSNGTVVKSVGGTGWMNIGSSWSTDWYTTSCRNNPTFKTTVKYQIRYNNGPGLISAWYTASSDNWTCS